jgi:hypothetical protein
MSGASFRSAVGFVGLCLACACSRAPSADGGPSEASARAVPAQSPSVVSAEAPSTTPAAPVLTPEDVEDAAEHRITEQNLESELDRLEREIQAE